jgi:hypothetical protein
MLRSWETQVWVMIIFSITIIIAIGFFWLLSYYYKQSLSNKKYFSVLWDIKSWKSSIQKLWLCKTSNKVFINYNPITDIYKLNCSSWLEVNLIDMPIVGFEFLDWCRKNDTYCKYKILK